MAAALTDGRRGLTAVRLSEIPIAVRRDAGASLLRVASQDARLAETVELTRAIEYPSETVYWVPTEDYERARRTRVKWR